MKNANSRFVRVLAVALVVLMVLPAALVGCGSNKANDAAISEALAAAQAAKDAADKAQQKAEAAQKELEEANKKAEQLEAELEALKTTKAPEATTAPVVVVDKQQLLAYIQEALADIADILSEVKWADYVADDKKAIEASHAMTYNAIYTADTIDEATEAVEAFKAYVEAMPTYADRVYEAYKAIDFASDVDVFDVVYAYNYLNKAVSAVKASVLDDKGTVDTEDDEYVPVDQAAIVLNAAKVAAYGEDELDLAKLIATEYYRYVGGTVAGADTTKVEKVLYEDIYQEAADKKIYKTINDLLKGDNKLDVDTLEYSENVMDDVTDAKALFEDWFDDRFAGEAIEANYEEFRQAFIGEAVILDLNKTEDAVWAAVLAMEERAVALNAALDAYEEGFQDELEEIAEIVLADIALNSDENTAEDLAAVRAALAAWIVEHDLADENGKPGDVVKSIIGKDKGVVGDADYEKGMYTLYEEKALLIDYISALNATTAAIDADGYDAALTQYGKGDLENRFDFAKYGAAVKSVIDWKTAFNAANPGTKGFEKFAGVAVTVDQVKLAGVYEDIIDNVFDADVAEFNTDSSNLETAYNALVAAKSAADTINGTIETLLKKGITKENLADFDGLAGASISEYFAAEKKDAEGIDAFIGGTLKSLFLDLAIIEYLDNNFIAMIDWAGLEKLSTTAVALNSNAKDAAVEIMNIYYATIATEDDTAKGSPLKVGTGDAAFYLAQGSEKLAIDLFAYDLVKKISAAKAKIDATLITSDAEFDYTVYTAKGAVKETKKITYEDAFAYAQGMLGAFHAVVGKVAYDLNQNVLKKLPLGSTSSLWNGGDKAEAADRAAAVLGNDNHKFNNEKLDEITDTQVKEKLAKYVNDFYAKTSSGKLVNEKYLLSSVVAYEETANSVVAGYKDSVVAVNPAKYFTATEKLNADGESYSPKKYTFAFDEAGYKKALDEKIAENYAKFQTSFVKTADATYFAEITKDVNAVLEVIRKTAVANDLWNLDGAFGSYTYTIDAKEATPVLTIYNKKNKVVEENKIELGDILPLGGTEEVKVVLAFKAVLADYVYDVNYDIYADGVKLDETVEDDKTKIENIKNGAIKGTDFKTFEEFVADELGFVEEENVFDVRKAATEIATVLADLGDVYQVDGTTKYSFVTAAQIQAIFDAEAKGQFNYEAINLLKRVYNTGSSGGSFQGTIIQNNYSTHYSSSAYGDDEESKAKLANYQAMLDLQNTYKALADAATDIEELTKIVDTFEAKVVDYFAEHAIS